MKKYIYFFLLLTITTNFAHKEWVHQYVVNQAYLMLDAQVANWPDEFRDMFLTSNGVLRTLGEPSHFTINGVIGGAWMEDTYDPVFLECYNVWPLGCLASSATHFWNPDNTNAYHTYELEYIGGTYNNAYEKINIYWEGDRDIYLQGPFSFNFSTPEGCALYGEEGLLPTMQYTIIIINYDQLTNMYKTGSYSIKGVHIMGENNMRLFDNPVEINDGINGLNSAFARTVGRHILGRMAHLIADMNVPAHVKLKSHPCDIHKGSYYEQWIGGKDPSTGASVCDIFQSNFEAQNYTYTDAISQGGYLKPWLFNDPLKYLMYTNAQIADAYNCRRWEGEVFSQDKNYNTIDPITGDNYYAMASTIEYTPTSFSSWEAEVEHQANTSFLYLIRATAGLFYWFAKEVDILPPPPVPFSVSISGPTYLNSYQTGTWTANASGGATPYHYQWWYRYPSSGEKKDDGSKKPPSGIWVKIGDDSQTISRYDDEDFELKCDVTDANNTTKTAYKTVYISGGAKSQLAKETADMQIDILPEETKLLVNFPNPFNPTTIINYQLKGADFVSLKVYDVLGKEVITLVNENKNAGYYEATFVASNLPSGIYIYKISIGNFTDVKKMLLTK